MSGGSYSMKSKIASSVGFRLACSVTNIIAGPVEILSASIADLSKLQLQRSKVWVPRTCAPNVVGARCSTVAFTHKTKYIHFIFT